MKFDYVIGNPPYAEEISTSKENKSLSRQIFPDFIMASAKLSNIATELVTPSRWFAGDAQDKSFLKLRDFFKQYNHISRIVHYPNENDVFKDVIIKGGVSYFVYKQAHFGNVRFSTITGGKATTVERPLFEDGLDIVLSDPIQISILGKVKSKTTRYLTEYTKGRNAFGIIGKESVIDEISEACPFENSCHLRIKGNILRYITADKVTKSVDVFNAYKVFISKSAGAPGKDTKIIGAAYLGEPQTACSDSLIPIGCFDNRIEAENLRKYMASKFLRYMVSILKMSQNVTQIVYRYVPLQNFTSNSDINWSASIHDIDQQLYKKYGLSQQEIDFIESHVKEMA
ncbi:Eco57I restriction-modification methylase domain-containing protein [Gemmiger sp.]